MNSRKDRRSPANFAYDIMASEDWKHDYPEWRDLAPKVQPAVENMMKQLLLADGWIPKKTT